MPLFPFHPGVPVRVVGKLRGELLPKLHAYPVTVLPEDSEESPALVISYGGDGTLLGAERDFPEIPKFALRDRTHNPRCAAHAEDECLRAFFGGELACMTFDKLTARVSSNKKTLTALNDIVLSRHLQPMGAIRYRVRCADTGRMLLPQVISDALVVATPYGSTGYFQSITRGNFQTGIGLAHSNPTEGLSYQILAPGTRLEVELLRGPALVQAGNNPDAIDLHDGDFLTIEPASQHAHIYGMEAFRCLECLNRRRNGEVLRQ